MPPPLKVYFGQGAQASTWRANRQDQSPLCCLCCSITVCPLGGVEKEERSEIEMRGVDCLGIKKRTDFAVAAVRALSETRFGGFMGWGVPFVRGAPNGARGTEVPETPCTVLLQCVGFYIAIARVGNYTQSLMD
jgi:hypothetical protein